MTVRSQASDFTHAVQRSAVSQAKDALGQVQQAAVSRAWRFPFLGMFYIASHPAFLSSLKGPLLRTMAISAAIVVGLFTFTYVPQSLALSVVSGPLGFVASVPLILAESYFLIGIVGRSLLLGNLTDRAFDTTLLMSGQEPLVAKGRSLLDASAARRGVMAKLGREISSPLSKFSPSAIARYIITLPLNAIPGAGTALFLAVNGAKSGPTYHDRYFQLKNFSSKQKETWIEERKASYTAFGTVALALSLVPVAGLAFNVSTAVGAALWAAEEEKKGKRE